MSDQHIVLILGFVKGKNWGRFVVVGRKKVPDTFCDAATLLADAGYDGEHVHEYAHEERGVNTFIPAKIGRPTRRKPSGFWRRRMAGPKTVPDTFFSPEKKVPDMLCRKALDSVYR